MGEMTVRQWFRRSLATAAPSTPAAEQPTRVGELELAGFQRRAVRRGLEIARAFGGVILADAVGLGKTRVALAIASALVRDVRLATSRAPIVWCCVPARLRRQWKEAAARAGLRDHTVVTHTQLSRGQHVDWHQPDVIVVDEAHRFRNPRAKRSRALADLASRARLVLATATPVCNDREDLYHLLSLFLAEHDLRAAVGWDLREAFALAERGDFDLTELVERVVIRRVTAPTQVGFGRRPSVRLEMLRYEAIGAERWLWRNLEAELDRMSMELFRADWPRGLLVEYVLKRWESGAEALRATLAQMSAFHRRWLEADDHGRCLSRTSFRRLFGGEIERSQGVFPFVFDAPAAGANAPRSCRRETVERDLERLARLEQKATEVVEAGDGKQRAIVELARGCEDKLLVFTGYQQAARALYEAIADGLGARAKVGLVTGQAARSTGLGRASGDELLRRFAPRSNGLGDLPEHQQLDVLVSTDCLAEGVNLQDCGEVVLADLPYSPLGVEQRVGRLLRPGGPHARVTVYLPRPHSWTDSLGMRRRLDDKLVQAADSGTAFIAAGQLAHDGGEPEDPQPGALGPLAALTRLEHLTDVLEAGDAEPIEPGSWGASAPRGRRRLWARVAIREVEHTRWMWCLVRHTGEPELRLSGLLDDLVRDADITQIARPQEPSSGLRDVAKEALARRERQLRAARLAPFPMRLDAPQRRVWLCLKDHVEAGALRLDGEEVAALRHGLLRSFPRGTEQRLAEFVDAELPARRLLAQVRRITDGLPEWSPDVRLEIVAVLEVG